MSANGEISRMATAHAGPVTTTSTHMAKQSDFCRKALEALYAPPLTAEELVEKQSRIAAEMARAEARRAVEPKLQGDLLEAE